MKECCAAYLSDQFGGDAEIMNEIYGEYIASVQKKLEEADATLAAGDWIALDRVAHTIKGNSLATGDSEMAQTAVELRSSAQLKDSQQATELITKLKTLAGQL